MEKEILKRSLMAKVARSKCEKIIITDDNPRNENPNKIRKEIVKHLKGKKIF